ncbi:helix-turn-helix domain-containing protein [Herbidospora sp. NBRC 101105]|uniref:winged helix-turn-helix transcriptional regulator n=1 Tax=Herbidospora sp. NBRC 101105 TaxID=3032195 RepID=UPI0024A399A4|nr:helix-turn-helix domain-containing protein [Herbidospora sp. NBRC 101105]GLX94339.1 transcriptional regulator [Herbidospora sp. NBRC 101105]
MGTDGADDIARLTAAPTSECGVERTLRVLDGKWSTLVIRELLSGPRRFGELRSALGDPSPKTLTERLRMLENQQILTRTVHAEVPPRVVYELTEQGRSLSGILHAMLVWGQEHPLVEESPAAPVRSRP